MADNSAVSARLPRLNNTVAAGLCQQGVLVNRALASNGSGLHTLQMSDTTPATHREDRQCPGRHTTCAMVCTWQQSVHGLGGHKGAAPQAQGTSVAEWCQLRTALVGVVAAHAVGHSATLVL